MKKRTSRILAFLLTLCMLTALGSVLGIISSAEDSTSPLIEADVPMGDVVIAAQDFEDVANNPALGCPTEASYYGKVADRMVICDANLGYDGGKYADFDYSTYPWDTWAGKTGSGGSVNITYPIGQLTTDGGKSSDLADFIPSKNNGFVLTLNFCNVTGFGGEYLWINVYGTDSARNGFKIRTNEFDAGIWYEIRITVTQSGRTATKTALSGENAGVAQTLKYGTDLLSTSRTSQFCITMYPVTSGDLSDERKAAHFKLDNIKLTTRAYSTEKVDTPIAEQDYEDLTVNSSLTLNSTTGHTTINIAEDGTTGNSFADFDYSALYSSADKMSAYGSGIIYTGKSDRTDQLPYVPNAYEGYTVSFKFRNLSEYADSYSGDRVWFCVYGTTLSGNLGFYVMASNFEKGVWFDVSITASNNSYTGTMTALDGENAGTVTDITSLIKKATISSSRSSQFCYTLYDNANTTSSDRYLSHYQIDDVKLTAKMPPVITTSIPDTLVDGEVTALLAAYDTDGKLIDTLNGAIVEGASETTAEFSLGEKYDVFANADSVKALFWDSIASATAYAQALEIGDMIHPDTDAPTSETATLEIGADMNPTVTDTMTVLAYTVSNSFTSANIPAYADGYNLLYLGQGTSAFTEIAYDASKYDSSTQDIVVMINNGEETVYTLIEKEIPKFTNVVIQLGANETMLNFTWFSLDDGEGTVRYAKESELVDGALPEDANVVKALRTDSLKSNYYGNKTTVFGLEPGTTYYYVLTNGEHSTEPKPVKIADSDGFTFAFAGDPQIGRGYGSDSSKQISCIEPDGVAWGRTLAEIVNSSEFAGTDFLMSAGDQINSTLHNHGYTYHELQWDAYSNHDELLSLPQVTVLGNHDDEPYAPYPYHTNFPNMLTKEDGSYYCPSYELWGDDYVLQGDYYFTYGKALFLVLNVNLFVANDDSEADTAADKAVAEEHGEFIERVMEITAGMDIRWTIVLYHESPYGSSYHGNYTTNSEGVYNRTEQYAFINMRTYLHPILYENGVDLILSGHDHCYTRTHVLKPAKDENGNYIDAAVITPYEDGSYVYEDGTTTPTFKDWTDKTGATHSNLKVTSKPVSVTNPDGMVHITGATSSGSQPNGVEYEHPYTAVTSKANTRQLSRIDITDTELTVVTYNMGNATTDNITLVDTFTIVHNTDHPGGHTYSEVGGVLREATCTESGESIHYCTYGCGEYITKEIPATGEHNYVDMVCTVCGAVAEKWTPGDDIYYAAWESYEDFVLGKAPVYASKTGVLDTTKIATIGSKIDDYDTAGGVDYVVEYVHCYKDVKIEKLITIGTQQHLTINLNTNTLTDTNGFRLVATQGAYPNAGLTIKNGTYDRNGGPLQCRSHTSLILENLTMTYVGGEFITSQGKLIHIKNCNITFEGESYITLNGINNDAEGTTQSFIIEGTSFTGNGSSEGFFRFNESAVAYHPKWSITVDKTSAFNGNFPVFARAYEVYKNGIISFTTTQTITFEKGVTLSDGVLNNLLFPTGGAKYNLIAPDSEGTYLPTETRLANDSKVKISIIDENGEPIASEDGKWWILNEYGAEEGADYVVSTDITAYPIVASNASGRPYLFWTAPRLGIDENGTAIGDYQNSKSEWYFIFKSLESGATVTLYDDITVGRLGTYQGNSLTLDLNGHTVTYALAYAFQLGMDRSGSWEERVIKIISSADEPGKIINAKSNHTLQPRPGTIFYSENVHYEARGTFMYGYSKNATFVNCTFKATGSLFVEGTIHGNDIKYGANKNMDFANREYRTMIFDNCEFKSAFNIAKLGITGTDGLDIVFMNGCVLKNSIPLLINTGAGTATNNIFFDVDTKFTDMSTDFYSVAAATQTVGVQFYSDITSYEDVVKDGAIVTGLSVSECAFWKNEAYYSLDVKPTVAKGDFAANLTLYSDFNLNFFTNPDVVSAIIYDGSELTRSEWEGKNKFVLSGIVPNSAADTLNFTVMVRSGEKEFFMPLSYSILKYANTVIAGNYTDADKQLVSAVMAYIVSAYEYTGKTAPEFSGVTYSSAEIGKAEAFSHEAISSVQLSLGSGVKVRFNLKSDYYGKLIVGDTVYEIDKDAPGTVGAVNYVTVNLRAYELYNNGIEVSDASGTSVYTLANYVEFANNYGDAKLTALIDALVDYSYYASESKNSY